MHADYTYPCTPKLPPHLAQSFTNIYLVLNPPTIFTLHVITQPFYANLYMLCVHWWSTFRLCWFLVSSCMKTLNIFKMPPCIHQCTLPFKRRGWWQPIAQTTAPMILLVIASARKCSLCWSKCWSTHTHSCTHWKLLWARSTNGLGAIGAIKVLACHNFPLDVKAAVHIQVGNSCLGV